MTEVDEAEIEEIRREVMEDFPDDPALQQVHMARRILALEAQKQGKTVGEISRSIVEKS
ncbi:MAG: hypothetical protein GWN97_00385 [Thermoplasmata archaeon]|nr:hypothetical protein [Thermoplasmata archaeon]NIS10419.1 hypothetical protein [Thermoplasmata archaeon]